MKASIKTISAMTGFSLATVSNALNNKRGVNKETAETIVRIAREIGYLNNGPRISRLKMVIYRASGVIVNDSPFFSSLIAGVEAECRASKLDMAICYLNRDMEGYESQLRELLNDSSSALLLLATEMDEAEAKKFEKAISPVLILDNSFEDLDFSAVLIDNYAAAHLAVRYLVQLGHRRIGYLSGEFRINNFCYRREGYMRALAEAGLPCDPGCTVQLPTNIEGSYAAMAKYLDGDPEMPTAYFADNDMIALGAMRALQQKGYRIPEDISVVGFDNLPFCAISDPPLTTIKVYNYEMGCAAVRRVVEMVNSTEVYKTKTEIRSSFVERKSACPPADTSPSSAENRHG